VFQLIILRDIMFNRLNQRIGFPEMPDLNLKVTPVVGESKYSFALIHDFLEARIRDELKVNLSRSILSHKRRLFV
jgi:hypothetical protein